MKQSNFCHLEIGRNLDVCQKSLARSRIVLDDKVVTARITKDDFEQDAS
jgi:hypothetical protein